jgi:NitT/TauT family transport system ATP-binding protein
VSIRQVATDRTAEAASGLTPSGPAASGPAASGPAAVAAAGPAAAGAASVRGAAGAREAVRITDVSKVYKSGKGGVKALDGVSLSVREGEFVCLIGASGCGKSTLLSLVAGLDRPTSGQVSTGGRRVTLMFQEPALFPWLTAERNVELALRARGVPRAGRRERTAELLETVRLGGFGDKRPHELSGGMRQRVAMARALAQDADVLLMDEPFGALDAMTRDLLHDELERICAGTTMTVLFVTHNVREAARLGDRVVLLSSRPGRVIGEYAVPRIGPRRIDSAEVARVAATLTDKLREEMGRHGN